VKFQRIATSTFALHDGTIISEGTCISMPAGPMAMDPEYYSNPRKFSATRFCTPDNTGLERSGEGFHRVLEFVDTENGNLHWGHGRFTCPGRWYASAVMKLMLAKIIENFDAKFPEGQSKRMPNVYMDLIVEPNPKQVVLFRSRG
jgi:cytochrome P450